MQPLILHTGAGNIRLFFPVNVIKEEKKESISYGEIIGYSEEKLYITINFYSSNDISHYPNIWIRKKSTCKENNWKNFINQFEKELLKGKKYNLEKYDEDEYSFISNFDIYTSDIKTIANILFEDFKYAIKIYNLKKHLLLEE